MTRRYCFLGPWFYHNRQGPGSGSPIDFHPAAAAAATSTTTTAGGEPGETWEKCVANWKITQFS